MSDMHAVDALAQLEVICRELGVTEERVADLLAARGEAVWSCRHDVTPPITWPEIARTAGVTEVAVTRAYQRAVQRRRDEAESVTIGADQVP